MNKLTSFAALVAAVLTGIISESVWSDETLSISAWPYETRSNLSNSAAVQTPAPASGAVPGWYPPPNPGGYAQTWQQAPRWPVPQQVYGYLPPYYPPGGQYRTFPAATAPAAKVNPLSAELKQTQEQLTAKNSELEMAHSMLELLRFKLQDNFAAEKSLSEKMAHMTLEQQALQVRVTELTETLNTANATLEQQTELINNHQAYIQQLTAERDQLHGELASRDEQLAALQSELQAATQALAQAKSRAGTAVEALSAARVQVGMRRDELSKLEAELRRLEPRLQSELQTRIEQRGAYPE